MSGVVDLPPFRNESDSKEYGSFVRGYEKQNVCMEKAITSLDSLSTQILQFVYAPDSAHLHENELTAQDRDKLKTSMTLMRSLLVQAQSKFKKMVEDNRRLATRIDTSIQEANMEVSMLRAELTDASQKVHQLAPLTVPAELVSQQALAEPEEKQLRELIVLREENTRLRGEIRTLHQELADIRGKNGLMATDENKASSYKLDLLQTQTELNRAKEAAIAMKADRKRLKAEKLELLGQLKQLYCTLEDKEAELRDFIRNYEQRMREGEETIRELSSEKENLAKELWQAVKQAEGTAEQNARLTLQLKERDKLISRLQQATDKSKGHAISTIKSTTSSSSADSVLKSISPPSSEDAPYTAQSDDVNTSVMSHDVIITQDPPSSARSMKSSASILSGSSGYHGSLENLRSNSVNRDILVNNPNAPVVLRNHSRRPLGPEHTGENVIYTDVKLTRSKKRSKSPGAFTRIFGKSRSRRSIAITDHQALEAQTESCVPQRLSMLSQENYQEKLSILEQCKRVPMAQWKAGHVLAWLEIELNMPLYGKICAENIKSGKVLLGLSDSELDTALDLQSPLHRRKLRLAIEEHRDPAAVKFPKAGSLDHTWVANRWISDLGLAQYRTAFEVHLVDGRLLNMLTRKDLERHLGIARKSHQISILHGIELLRRVKFSKEILHERRSKCEKEDIDPLVWTNQRLLKWLQDIDLHEYSMALNETGLHGAVLVLEPSFTSESFGNLLGISPNRSYVRRHLATEFESLVIPARAALDTPLIYSKKRASGSLGRESARSMQRSYRSSGAVFSCALNCKGTLTSNGSFSRALGKKSKESNSDVESRSGDTTKQNSNMDVSSNISTPRVAPPKPTGTSV